MAKKENARPRVNQRRSSTQQTAQGLLQKHLRIARETLRRLLRSPLSLCLSWLVVAIALALPTVFFLLIGNVQVVSQGLDGVPRISLYLSLETSLDQRVELKQRLLTQPGLSDPRYISPEQALASFQQTSGLAEVAAGLDHNPLPPVLSARLDEVDPDALQVLEETLVSWPGVEQVQLDRAWVLRLHNMLQLGQRLGWAIGLLLAAGVLLIIGNTIRLAIENRREEILVVKLVGGSNSYVRRPFLYLGIWLGMGGGVLASLLVATLLQLLDGPAERLAKLYASAHQLQGLGFDGVLALIALGCVLGWLGAFLSCNRHLRAIEPR